MAAALDGPDAASGVVVGTAAVVLVLGLGTSVTHAVARLSPALSLLVALMTYVVQLLVLLLVLRGLEGSTWWQARAERAWVGGAVIGATLVWSLALLRAAVRRTAHEDARYHAGPAGGQSAGSAEVIGGGGEDTAG